MPIRFRCGACNKLLGIATRKAGTDIACPHCATLITVPSLTGNEDPVDLSEIDELLDDPSPDASAPTPPAVTPNVELVTPSQSTPSSPKPVPVPPVPRQGDLMGHVVLSYTTLTVIVIGMAVSLFLAFVAGFRMGRP